MSNFYNYINTKLKSTVEFSTNFFKISLVFGIILALNHFRQINYLPKDLDIGDGFLFILISFKFALIYLFFLGSCYIFGATTLYIIKNIKTLYTDKFYYIDQIIVKFLLLLTTDVMTWKFYEKFMIFLGGIFALLFSILFYFLFWQTKLIDFLLFIGCGICVAGFVHIFKKAKKANHFTENEKHLQMALALLFMTILPFIIYSYFTKSEKLTNFAISSLQEDDKNAIFYVKKDYLDLLPKEIVINNSNNYAEIKNTKIILRGFGRNALIEYEYNEKNKVIKNKLEIPNEAIQIKWSFEKK